MGEFEKDSSVKVLHFSQTINAFAQLEGQKGECEEEVPPEPAVI